MYTTTPSLNSLTDAQKARLAAIDGDQGLPPQTAYHQTQLFQKCIRSEVILKARPAEIWGMLTDFANYQSWNKFTPRVNTTLADGDPVEMEVHFLAKKPLNQTEWVHSVSLNRRICWGTKIGSVFTANRSQWLIPLGETATLYRTDDRLSGLLAPIVIALYGKGMQQGFDAVCAGLKDRFGEATDIDWTQVEAHRA